DMDVLNDLFRTTCGYLPNHYVVLTYTIVDDVTWSFASKAERILSTYVHHFSPGLGIFKPWNTPRSVLDHREASYEPLFYDLLAEYWDHEDAIVRDLESETGIPKSNLSHWSQQKEQHMNFDGNLHRRFNLNGAGQPEEIPDTDALTVYMLKLRETERVVTCTHLVNYLKRHHNDWLEAYLQDKRYGYQTLLHLLQTFYGRHGFSRQKPTKAKRL
ncbi:hypothetical protein DYB38_012928, partial [Aphanomyces astaci]